jgi:hypothetical protein
VPRTCLICAHDEAHVINVELVSRVPYRDIERRYKVGRNALKRHSEEHIPQLLVEAKQAVDSAEADDLILQVQDLQAKTIGLLNEAEDAGELRTALAAIREARGNVELLAKLRQIIDDRPQVNLYLSSEWLEIRALIVTSLEPHPEARGAVLSALEGAPNGRGGGWDGA